MAGIASGSFDQPDETRTPDKTRIEVVRLGATTAARITFQPGWRWSKSIKPVVHTYSCQARHVGTVASGRGGKWRKSWSAAASESSTVSVMRS